jgi:hypothetical protein
LPLLQPADSTGGSCTHPSEHGGLLTSVCQRIVLMDGNGRDMAKIEPLKFTTGLL